MKNLGVSFRTFYTDGCRAYYNASSKVFGQKVAIQYDYFHIIQNAWRHLWKWAVAHRHEIKKLRYNVTTPWYKNKLETLAVDLWENRYLLFKAEPRMSDDEKERLQEIMTLDQKVGNLRAFCHSIWRIFEESRDETDASLALEKLKTLPTDSKNPKSFKKVIKFLDNHFDWMTAALNMRVSGAIHCPKHPCVIEADLRLSMMATAKKKDERIFGAFIRLSDILDGMSINRLLFHEKPRLAR